MANSIFPVADVPSARWSLVNRTLQFFAGTADGRGFQQWKAANRFVSKGARAFHILVPYIKKEENEETGEDETTLKGFMACPVFRVEDTEGEPLDYEKIVLPQLPLMERAREWGISVKAIPGDYRYYGYFAPEKQEIVLATPEEKTFFTSLLMPGTKESREDWHADKIRFRRLSPNYRRKRYAALSENPARSTSVIQRGISRDTPKKRG